MTPDLGSYARSSFFEGIPLLVVLKKNSRNTDAILNKGTTTMFGEPFVSSGGFKGIAACRKAEAGSYIRSFRFRARWGVGLGWAQGSVQGWFKLGSGWV